jgi:Holliday junction resolvase RusA-like endonuclease
MTIQVLTIPLKAFPKPRGKLSRTGHIYHSSKEYVQWNKDFAKAIREAGFKPPESTLYFCFKFLHKPGKGRSVDGENCQGAIQDALVKCNVIEDDNINVISRWYGEFTKSEVNIIYLYFCQTKKEFIHVINKYMDK